LLIYGKLCAPGSSCDRKNNIFDRALLKQSESPPVMEADLLSHGRLEDIMGEVFFSVALRNLV
jgi:hypothetical protein